MNRNVAFLLIAIAVLLPISCGDRNPTEPDRQSGSFTIDVPASAIVGEPFMVTVTAVADDGTAPDPAFDGSVAISASSGTLTIDDLTLADGVGTATVAVFGATGRITLSVVDAADPSRTGSTAVDISAAGEAGLQITSDSAFLLIAPGDTARAAAMVFRDDGSADSAAVVTWTSSDPSVVQVDGAGLLTAVADVGSATVTARSGALTSRPVNVSVVQPAANTRVINASLVTGVAPDGSTVTLSVSPETSALEAGNIIVSSAGIIARITGVAASADAITLTLEPARLNEAFVKLRIAGTTAAAPVEANISSRGIALYSLSGQFVPQTFPLGALQCTREDSTAAQLEFSGGDIRVESSPTITFSYSLDYGLGIDDLEMFVEDRPSVGVSSATLALNAQTEGSINCMYELPVALNIPVATIAGIVTVTGRLAPSIGFELSANASGEVKISTPSPSAGVQLKLGAAYDGPLDEWSMITEADPFFEPGTLGDFTEEVTAEFGATALIPLVAVAGGVNLKIGTADAVGLDFVKPKVFGSFEIGLEHPFTPAQREYKGAVWDLSVKATADISIKLTGAVAEALEYFDVDASYEQEGFELFSIPVMKSPEIAVTATHGANGSVDLSASTGAGYSGSRVEFWAFADGEATAESIAEATLDAFGQATAEWDLPDDGGEYEVVAYVYGSPFSAIDLPYPSALTSISSDSVTVHVAPENAVVSSGEQRQFTATVTGASNTGVTWSVQGSGGVDGNGLYTAGEPTQVPTLVIATSIADPAVSDTGRVIIPPPPCIPTPESPCSGGSGASSGDPHLMTFDGQAYDFMAAGDFRLVKSIVAGDAFEVQTRYRKPDAADRWSWNNAVAMNVAGDTVEVYSTDVGGMDLVINGQALAAENGLSRVLSGGGHAGMENGRLTISWPDRTMVEIRPASWESNVLASVRVLLPDDRFGSVEGLFGDFDGDPADDVRIRNGETVNPSSDELYMDFRQSWRVPYGIAGSMFSRGPDPWDALFPPDIISIDDLDPAAVAAARDICAAAGIVHPSVADGCAFDVALTGDDEWALIALGIDPAVPGVTLVPGGAIMLTGESRQFGGVVSGTTNRTVTWSATGGTIAEDSPNVMTYTAPAAPGTYTITARLAGNPAIASTGTIRVFAGTPGGKIWTGELSDIWSEPRNWLPEGAPTATDDVTISAAAAPNAPRLTANATARNLVHESGTIDLSNRVLTLTGSADSRGSYAGTGRVEMTGSNATVQGTFTKLTIGGTTGVVTASGDVTVSDSLVVNNSGVLDLGAHTVDVEGVFRTVTRAVLRMQHPAAVLRVAGKAHFSGGSTIGHLTAGTIEVAGDFLQERGQSGCCNSFPTSFQPSGTLTVVLNGGGTQNVAFTSGGLTAADSYFRALHIENGGHVIFAGSPAVTDTLLVTGPELMDGPATLELAGVTITAAGSTLATTGVVLEGVTEVSGTFSPDTVWFAGRHRPIQGGLAYRNAVVIDTVAFAGDAHLTGSLLIDQSGLLDLAGHAVNVGDSINTRLRGKLRMQDPSGVLRIAGSARFAGGDLNGLLTAGTIEVSGNFTQARGQSGCCNSFPRSFQASGTHTVVLNGTAPQTVTFQDAGLAADRSRFASLRIDNSGTVHIASAAAGGAFDVIAGATLEGAGALEVAGAFTTGAGSSVTVDRVLLHGPMNVAGTFSPDTVWFDGTGQQIQGGLGYNHMIVRDTVAFGGDAEIAGSMVVTDRGILDIAANTVTVSGGFLTEQIGKLRMQDAAGTLRIAGTVQFGGGDTNGLLTAGTIEASGNFIQRQGHTGCCNSYPRSFQASGAHTVLLNGTALQTVDFGSGGLAADRSRFATLRIVNTTDVSFLGNAAVGGSLDLLGYMTVPADVTLDIGATFLLRAASVLNNQGTISVPSCTREPGSTINGIDPCS